jgi:hypothetical protein
MVDCPVLRWWLGGRFWTIRACVLPARQTDRSGESEFYAAIFGSHRCCKLNSYRHGRPWPPVRNAEPAVRFVASSRTSVAQT